MSSLPHYEVAIVGAGFSGTMTAVNLVNASALSVALLDRNSNQGPGLAYGTKDSGHLLNVRAGQMGAFPDTPRGFFDALTTSRLDISDLSTPRTVSDQDFIARALYGRYIKQTLHEATLAHSNLTLLKHDIIEVKRARNGPFSLRASDNIQLTADRLVLALGNFMPRGALHAPVPKVQFPNSPTDIADDGDILVIGTGLTCLDLLVTLAKTKARGTLHLISRHGLLPREHVEAQSFEFDMGVPLPLTALGMLKKLRAEILRAAPNVPWQSVIDAIRPQNQEIWRRFSPTDKKRFLRHLRSYWEVHRHRCAPSVMDAYRSLAAMERLVLYAGKLLKTTETTDGWNVSFRERGKDHETNLAVRHVVHCMGPESDIERLTDPLVMGLLAEGLVQPDELKMGFATKDTYRLCQNNGNAGDGFYTLGNSLKGLLYESVAVPELRQQAKDVADLILKDRGRR